MLKLGLYILFIIFLLFFRNEMIQIYQNYSIRYQLKLKNEWQNLLNQLILNQSLIGLEVRFPKYKFYEFICYEIIDGARKWGLEYREHFTRMREQIQDDFYFTLRRLKAFWQSMSQFVVIVLITWIFRLTMSSQLSINLKLSTQVLSLQIIGFVIFISFDQIVYRKKLKLFDDYFYSLYLFKGLLALNLPFQFICEKTQVYQLIKKRDKLIDFRKNLETIIESILHCGGDGSEERLGLLCSELKYLQDLSFDEVHKTMSMTKLVVILFFFFPAYLLNIKEVLTSISI